MSEGWGTSNDLKILVDGEEVEFWGIFDDWTERTIEVSAAGEHTVTWRYVNMNGDINDYARLCNISATSAEARAERLDRLRAWLVEQRDKALLPTTKAIYQAIIDKLDERLEGN